MISEQIKAVIFDIDGTAMLNKQDALPSDRLAAAVRMIQEAGIHVSCATGRNFDIAKHITDKLNLIDPSIFSGGTQILKPDTGEELWTGYMSLETVSYALQVLSPYNVKTLVDGDTYETALLAGDIIPKSYRMLDVQHVTTRDVITITKQLSELDSVAVIPVDSHDPEKVFLHITDKLATKEHAVQELLRILDVLPKDAVGIGDGLNDIELFKSVGHKVAMGNAKDELKQAADEVIESVDNDGLALYLERLVA